MLCRGSCAHRKFTSAGKYSEFRVKIRHILIYSLFFRDLIKGRRMQFYNTTYRSKFTGVSRDTRRISKCSCAHFFPRHHYEELSRDIIVDDYIDVHERLEAQKPPGLYSPWRNVCETISGRMPAVTRSLCDFPVFD